ncbi:glycoside hydrolase family 47 protein [Piedraia hortae CBS 480.64]|uniref:alpha-1,2-Mannosidase n=1 Tax=Piedraia hortae CBS 480.64 TaxID=1314780 RepID=A0A6A7C3G9_9PEZI|nr:glycoside hydrolase family 47 protein [Piedraia hortae CBS 480.64]
MLGRRRNRLLAAIVFFALVFTLYSKRPQEPDSVAAELTRIHWTSAKEQFPISTTMQLPTATAAAIPRIQIIGPKAGKADKQRLDKIREATQWAWNGYRNKGWGADEIKPVSGGVKNLFNGWGATLVDSLDTLWIMDMKKEFDEAVEQVKNIDFTTTKRSDIPLFETTIRYLGGLIGAYDVTGRQQQYAVLLHKAVELADVLYSAFDTPNRMPQTYYRWRPAFASQPHRAGYRVILAELGSLSLEFTRLAQLTGEPKYYDAVQRITDALEEWQNNTRIPGMWPINVDASGCEKPAQIHGLGSASKSGDETFSLGAMSDSTYEYLPKEYLLLGGKMDQYKKMYERAADVAKKYVLFRPMTPDNVDILFSGVLYVGVNITDDSYIYQHVPEAEHLSCFAGGMFAMGGKIFNRPEEVEIGAKLTNGCVWAYNVSQTGIMPEKFLTVRCSDSKDCPWDEKKYWAALDPKYILRPEAIESVFYMFRITGNEYWREVGWNMFVAIDTHTRTSLAHSAVKDVTMKTTAFEDSMESFWIAETLKYFYLLFEDSEKWSLDDYVFNTEAHPFKRM